MWFLFQHPDEYLDRFNEERRRSERTTELTRTRRGSSALLDASPKRHGSEAVARTDQQFGRFAGHRA